MLGSNVPTIGGLHTGFEWADKWGCESIQIYLTLSRRWDVQELAPEQIEKFKNSWQASSVKEVVAHIPFLVNLASSDKLLRDRSINRLVIEISRAEKLGVRFLVLHPGSCTGTNKKEGLKNIIDGLNIVLQRFNNISSKILLETMAGQGNVLGASFEELATIINHVDKSEFLGVCFDTGHVFMSGYKFKGYEGYEEVMNNFDKIISIGKIEVFHLNDSKTSLNSKSDRHACIGEGELGLQVFHALLRDKRFFNRPKILEIPERDIKSKKNLDLLKNLERRIDLLAEETLPTQLNLI